MKRSLVAAILAFCVAIGIGHQKANSAATLLPNGEQCFSANTGVTGMVGLLGTITGGSGGTNGTYGGVSLTGGSGSGATANVTVSGGIVTAVAILNPGTQYIVGDVLSAASVNIGNVTGFSVPIASVSINSALAGGSVAFYVPNTNTFKQTWQDANQTVLNTNPISLDANGCAVIYGTGSYRQVVKDSLGNTVWDKLTTDTSANNNTFWAGNATGSPNAIVVTDPGFNGTNGSIINFVPIYTNTGPTTLSVSPTGYVTIPIVKDTTAGPVALVGGEIVTAGGGQSNVVSVIYNSVQNNFHLLNTVIASASGSTAPLCGASGLQVINNSGTPNIILNMTASQAVMQSASGLIINRSNVSLPNINISTGTTVAAANGMDGESPGTSQWLYVWMIDNGAAPAGLVSTSATAPTLPSGYIYKCRMGTWRVDGSGNLVRLKQAGPNVQYVVSSATTTALPSIASGASGSVSTPTYTAVAVGALFPPTATTAKSVLFGVGAQAAILAPNGLYGAITSTTNPPPCVVGTNSAGGNANIQCTLLLESGSLYYAASGSGVGATALGWIDSVNAN